MAHPRKNRKPRRISEKQWLFSETRLPSEELLICCRYEYARESVTTRRVLEENLKADYELREQIEWDYPEVFLAFHTGKKSFNQPWLAKTKSDRRKVVESFPSNQAIATFPHGQFTPDDDPLRDPHGSELFHLKVNWGQWTNAEIVDAFTRWIHAKDTRPQSVPEPKKRGKNPDDMLRTRLECLGILRLLHAMPYEKLPENRPHGDKWRVAYTARKEAKKAAGYLQELFPFLPEDELPMSSDFFES